jgi:hypothetical protein
MGNARRPHFLLAPLTIGDCLVLAACGTDTPTAPPTSTPAAPAPAVVTITAQINTNSVSGAWYFFDGATDTHPNNFDVYVETADQCNASGQFGFAMNATTASGTTTEGFEITVIDLSTNLRRTVTNLQGEPADPLDVPDFFTCP